MELAHRLESVKILPDQGGNDPDLYGHITAEAISRAEITAPERPRAVCLAVTAEGNHWRGRPSSWSAKLDDLAYGNGTDQRLIVISAGNIRDAIPAGDYINRNDVTPIESPAQAWNALTVGASTEKTNIVRPRAKAIEDHVRGNLGSGTIHLEVETKHGTRYRAERPWGDDVQVLDGDSDPVPVSLDRDLVFKADVYSQNEIEEIATNPRFQLSLIDKFSEEGTRADIHGDSRDDAIPGLLSALESRYGLRARRAALNVAAHLHHRFVRQAYHETVGIISPLDASLLNLEKDLAGVQGIPDHTLLHVRRAQARVRLIAEFLDNLRAFTTDIPPEFAVEALRPIMRDAVDLALSHVDGQAAEVDVQQTVDDSLKLEADRSRLLQALINIVVNAVEACADQTRRGVLAITAQRQADVHIKIAIADNGCGMSEEALRDCVLLYSSGKAGGMGFGLPLAKKIIEIDHGGTLSVESRQDVGTTVTVVLPAEQMGSEA